jgi:hypothetical protein
VKGNPPLRIGVSHGSSYRLLIFELGSSI